MNFSTDNLVNTLIIMGQGMAGIFIVLITISLIVMLLARLTSKKEKKADKK